MINVQYTMRSMNMATVSEAITFVLVIVLSGEVTQAMDSSRFLVLGDWGGLPDYPFTTPVEVSVSKQMAAISSSFGPQFVLALGDNFYFDGVKDVTDMRFKETYESVYTDKTLSVPWYLVAGNHDHNGNVSAQIAYSKVDPRWNFPNYYYKLSKTIPNSNMTIDILMIDTVVLCGNSDDDRLHQQPKGPQSYQKAQDQWTWIQDQLKSSKANYLLVAGHYPVYSIAEHGPTQCLIDKLLPMLEMYNVTAYINGHDHNLQHLEVVQPKLKMNYFTVGAANFVDTSNKHKDNVPKDSSKFFWAKLLDLGGFASVETLPTNMTLEFIDGMGHKLYQKVLFPRY